MLSVVKRTLLAASIVRGTLGTAGPLSPGGPMEKHRIFTMSFASVYPLYVQKAEKKGRAAEKSGEARS